MCGRSLNAFISTIFGSTIAPPNVDMARFLASETAKYQAIVDFAKIKE